MEIDKPPDPGGSTRKRHVEDAISDPTPKKTIIIPAQASPSVQTIYVHSSFAEGPKAYTEDDKGPFIIHVSREISDPSAVRNMLQLHGNNLGKRQHELNTEIYKARSTCIDFNLIKTLEEESDVDRLYKIEVASIYKNVDYMIETLKCGDSLYIARALKSTWLYEKEYSSKINPDYLHHEVFPYMSIKNKKKMLSTISMHVQEVNRALDFYNYCAADITLDNIALKFLIWTSEENKMKYIENTECDSNNILKIRNFIGDSFNLFEAYLAKKKKKINYVNDILQEFRGLYKTSNKRYLDFIEHYTVFDTNSYYVPEVPKLGLRISKDIILNHKDRVVKNPQLYFLWLNHSIIAKHSSVEEAKHYAINLLPASVTSFWEINFYNTYKAIFKLFPQNEIYSFLRHIFLEKYPNEPFEMSIHFYNLHYYNLLTDEEKEVWALDHIKSNDELLGPNEDYLWYQFVNYDLAFKEIKKYIYITNDRHKRADMTNVLINCVKNEEQMESLIKYYYERHVNEVEDVKLIFIDKIVKNTNVFKFRESCWVVFNKLLHSGYNSHRFDKYKTLAILYNIIHHSAIPNVLENYLITEDNAYNIIKFKNKLSDEEISLIYKYFFDVCTNKLKELDNQVYDDEVSCKAENIISFIVQLIEGFGKTKNDCPDIVLKYMKLDSTYKSHYFLVDQVEEMTEAKLLRILKLDSELVLKTLTQPPNNIFPNIRMNKLLKKIKIYFSNDIAKNLLSCCDQWLLESRTNKYTLLENIVLSIFHLSSDDYKIAFMSKYVPKEPKISHDTIDNDILAIQRYICAFVHHSRPPLPLSSVLPYIKGDYVRYCLPMFNAYSVHLPMPQCLEFITAILDTPVSSQKHGLRLAFEIFGIEDLSNLIVKVWKTTKNVSLRLTIYKALFNKIKILKEPSQAKLYETLKMLTISLNENDDDEIFSLLPRFDLTKYKGNFFENAWSVMKNWTENRSINIDRKCTIINEIYSNFEFIDKEFCRNEIIEEFVQLMLINNDMRQDYENNKVNILTEAKWNLTAKYIIQISDDSVEKSLQLVNSILNKCIEMFDALDNGVYACRIFMFQFIKKMCQLSYWKSNRVDSNAGIPVIEYILKLLTESLPMKQIYPMYIELNVIIISKKVIVTYKQNDLVDIANRLASTFIEFLEDLNTKKLLYSSFYRTIASLMYNAIYDMICDQTKMNFTTVVTLVSSYLAEVSLFEIRLIAVMLLPVECPKQDAHFWKKAIEKIQRLENDELDTYIYENIIHTYFKPI